MEIVSRFAPSPNGPMHMGHAYSAVVAQDLAKEAGGRFLLRIEDLDDVRSRPELIDEYRRNLDWLGLEWEEVAPQSDRLDSYEAAARRMLDDGLLYRCICTRSDIAAAQPAMGPEGPIYPGTCRHRDVDPSQPAALRLDLRRALERVGPLHWEDALKGRQQAQPELLGDVVLVRKDLPASYHLAATLDDAADGVTLVTRGSDLFAATHIHRVLQALFGLPVPCWHHHDLVLDEQGRKLAKRRGSPGIADLRESGEDGLLLAEQLRLRRLSVGT
ncbi:MAG: tRNA glutamyl-Q(34) synthetase GluQRS [Pseudomonadota bacterium]